MVVGKVLAMHCYHAARRIAGSTAAGASKAFISARTVGTGSSQNIAHGFGSTPRTVWLFLEDPSGVTAASAVQGSHGSTNVVCTVTNGAYFWAVAYY